MRFVVTTDGGQGKGELDQSGQKGQTSGYKINMYQGYNVQEGDYS